MPVLKFISCFLRQSGKYSRCGSREIIKNLIKVRVANICEFTIKACKIYRQLRLKVFLIYFGLVVRKIY